MQWNFGFALTKGLCSKNPASQIPHPPPPQSTFGCKIRINPDFCVLHHHQRTTTVSLLTSPFIYSYLKFIMFNCIFFRGKMGLCKPRKWWRLVKLELHKPLVSYCHSVLERTLIWYAKCNLLKNLEIWEMNDSFLRIVNPEEAFKEDTAIEYSISFWPRREQGIL